MFSHITIGTKDIPRALAFYDAALAPLGIKRVPGTKYANWAAWRRDDDPSTLWVGKPFNGEPADRGNGWMVAFAASSKAEVDAAHAAAMAAGGTDEGAPGLRPQFAADYYGAYVRDLDGNKLHFVTRGVPRND
jgi:catechol 2,3-dioxygenase-like lactoylglutathione lyase family enzyme